IITGPGQGGGPQIRVFNGIGQVENNGFFAYASHLRTGVQVTAADINDDGKDEIITGAGPGGGPQIRAFSADGGVVHNGFFAYDKSFRGGVNVAVGEF
ncbi:FG-GAP repeat protein, partial [Patescibacteria group bacterium]|nr:FG-GAP repeat protein [Patescibacteria group bacterium]